MNRTKNVIKNSIIMLVYQVFTFVSGFIVPGLILNTYGSSLHGLISIIVSIMGYIALLNVGLTTAGIHAMYKPLALRDSFEVNSVLNAIDKFYCKTGYMYTIAVIISSSVLPFFIGDDISKKLISVMMIIIGMRNTLECFIYSKYKVLLQADQKLYVVTNLDIITIIIKTTAQIILILLNFDIMFVYLVDVVFVILRSYTLKKYMKKNYTFLDSSIKPDFSKLGQRWSAFIHQISTLILNNTDIMIILFFFDLKAVSIYTIYNMVFSHITSLINNVFSSSSVASFGNLISHGKIDRIKIIYNSFELLFFLLLGILLSCTCILIIPFVELYTAYADVSYVDNTLALLFIIVAFLNNIRIPGITMISAAGHFRETQSRAIAEALINIIASIILVQFYGLYGVLLGTIVSFLYRTIDIIVYSNHIIMKKSIKWTVIHMIKLLLTILSVFFVHYKFQIFEITNWISWVLDALYLVALSTFVSLLVFSVFEKNVIRDVFSRIFIPLAK